MEHIWGFFENLSLGLVAEPHVNLLVHMLTPKTSNFQFPYFELDYMFKKTFNK